MSRKLVIIITLEEANTDTIGYVKYRGSIIRVGVAFYITFCFACLFDCLLENYFQINVKDNVLDKVTTSYCFSELWC